MKVGATLRVSHGMTWVCWKQFEKENNVCKIGSFQLLSGNGHLCFRYGVKEVLRNYIVYRELASTCWWVPQSVLRSCLDIIIIIPILFDTMMQVCAPKKLICGEHQEMDFWLVTPLIHE